MKHLSKWHLMFASRRELVDTSVTVCAENERVMAENAALKRRLTSETVAFQELLRKERAKTTQARQRALDLEAFLEIIQPGEAS